MRKGPPEQLIRGLVISSGWNENGDVTAVSIQDINEKEYIVDLDEKGKELLAYLRRKVEIRGTVKRSDDGSRKVKVRTFRIINSAYEFDGA